MAEDRAPQLLEALPVAALLIGSGERIDHANATARQILGDSIVGRHFITALRQPAILSAIEAVFRGQPRQVCGFRGSDGVHDVSYEATVDALWDGLDRQVIVSFQDTTPLQHAGQMRRDFVANVSHELRTPLTALIGYIETLQGPGKDDPRAAERFLGRMADEADRMNRLIADLLSLSRVEEDQRVRPTDRVELGGLVRTCAERLEGKAEAAGVALTLDLPGVPVTVRGDAGQLSQLLDNLVENGIKYGGAAVTVSLTEPKTLPALRAKGVALTVADAGQGIDPLHLPRLTERFYRVDDHRGREVGGTGLGLAIVKHIVTRHRGRLKIDSVLKEGTKFVVSLPV
ncbi:ATP-binding protein [Pseudaestuariivita sp.]|uniref:ATP-binding protein n=1 Tax=Pseudaestuariivita sp. TaxID=2211669 RepID=UPI00405A260C